MSPEAVFYYNLQIVHSVFWDYGDIVFDKSFTPSGWAFSGLLADGEAKKATLPKIVYPYPTMILQISYELGTVIPYLKKIPKTYEPRDTLL